MKKKNYYSRLLLDNKKVSILVYSTSVAMILEIILTVLMADLFKKGIDMGLSGDPGYSRIAIGLVSIIIIFATTIFFKDLLLGLISERSIANLKLKASTKFTKLPIYTLDTMHSGDNLSKLTNDIELVKRFLDWDGYFLILRPLMALASLGYLTYLNWQLTLASIILTPLLMVLTMKISEPINNYSKALQEELANINKTNQDILGGIQIVKSFNLRDRILNQFKDQIDQSVKSGRLIAIRRGILMGVSTVLTYLPFLVSFGLGSYLVTQGRMSPGALLAFINLLNQLAWPLSQIPNHIASYKASLAGLDNIYGIIDLESERTTGSNFEIEKANSVVAFNNVEFAYTDKNVLNGLSFNVNKGEKIAIVGPSGGGKSTVFKLITGFYNSNEGEINLFDKPIKQWNLEDLRNKMAMVSQDTYLFPTTVAENISLGREDVTLDEIVNAAKMANAHDFITKLPNGYDTVIGERGSTLSGGQRQRLSIARAILKNAPVLLLDEATSALDTESESLVQEALEKAMEDRTTLVIAHRLSTIKNVDRILVVENGTVVEEGSHENLLAAKGLYYKLYNKDFVNTDIESGVA